MAVAVFLLLAHQAGVLEQFGEPSRLKQALIDAGGWGYALFIVAYAAFQPFGLPGTVFIVAAALIWPWPVAFVLSMVGTMAASVVGFSFARFVARDWIAAKIPKQFRKYDDALARRAFATVFLMRLVFWMPPMLHAFFGVSRVRFSTHFWASLIGYVLPLLAVSYFAQQLFDMVKSQPSLATIGPALAVLIALGWWLLARRRRPKPA